MSGVILSTRVIALDDNNGPFRRWGKVRIWPGPSDDGRPCAFRVGPDGCISGTLNFRDADLESDEGERLCFVRVHRCFRQLAAGMVRLKWQDGAMEISGEKIRLGALVTGRILRGDDDPPHDAPKSVEIYDASTGVRLDDLSEVSVDGRFWANFKIQNEGPGARGVVVRYGFDADTKTVIASTLLSEVSLEVYCNLTIGLAATSIGDRPRSEQEAPEETDADPNDTEDSNVPTDQDRDDEKTDESTPVVAVVSPPTDIDSEKLIRLSGAITHVSKDSRSQDLELELAQDRVDKIALLYQSSLPREDRYTIEIPEPENASPIYLSVFHRQAGRTKPLFKSEEIPPRHGEAKVDILIEDPLSLQPAFDRVLGLLRRYLDGKSLFKLSDEEWRRSARFLNEDAPDLRQLENAVGFTRLLETRFGLNARKFLPPIFALSSPGEALLPSTVFQNSTEYHSNRLRDAVENKRLGEEPWRYNDGKNKSFQSTEKEWLAFLKKHMERVLLAADTDLERRVLIDIVSLLPQGEKKRKVLAIAAAAGDEGEFLTKVDADSTLNPEEKQKIRTLSDVNRITRAQPGLAPALIKAAGRDAETDATAIARLSPEEIASVIKTAKRDGGPTAENEAVEPERILEDVFQLAPTKAFLARGSALQDKPSEITKSQSVLAKVPDFDLFSEPVSGRFFVRDQETENVPSSDAVDPDIDPSGAAGSKDSTQLTSQQFDDLSKIQRIAKIAPLIYSADAITAIIRAEKATGRDFGSAFAISSTQKEYFYDALRNWLPDHLISRIHSNAQKVTQMTCAVVGDLVHSQRALRQSNWAATPYQSYASGVAAAYGADKAASTHPPATNGFKNLEDLFGSLDSCACENCRSAYSAAAYLADLLHWLRTDFVWNTGGREYSGYGALMRRRGDIGNKLELSCANTHTILPYLAIVNEILEFTISRTKIEDLSVLDYQTTWDTPKLLRDDEHFHFSTVYSNQLLNAKFPWVLPFNLWEEQVRAYLKELGIGYERCVEIALKLTSQQNAGYIAAAVLGLSREQYAIVITPNVHRDSSWTFSGSSSLGPLNVVETALKISGLSYDQLVEALATHYVHSGAGNPTKIVFDDEDRCDLNKAEFDPPPTDGQLDRLHRIARLADTIGWSIKETSTAISLFSEQNSGDPLNEGFLLELSQFERLRRRFRIDHRDWLQWFASEGSASARIRQLSELLRIPIEEIDVLSTISGLTNNWLPSGVSRLIEIKDWLDQENYEPAALAYLAAGSVFTDQALRSESGLTEVYQALYEEDGAFDHVFRNATDFNDINGVTAAKFQEIDSRIEELLTLLPEERHDALVELLNSPGNEEADFRAAFITVFPHVDYNHPALVNIAAAATDLPTDSEARATESAKVKARIWNLVTPRFQIADALIRTIADAYGLSRQTANFLLYEAEIKGLANGPITFSNRLAPQPDANYANSPPVDVLDYFDSDGLRFEALDKLNLLASRIHALGIKQFDDLNAVYGEKDPVRFTGQQSDAPWFDIFDLEGAEKAEFPSFLSNAYGSWKNLADTINFRKKSKLDLPDLIAALKNSAAMSDWVNREPFSSFESSEFDDALFHILGANDVKSVRKLLSELLETLQVLKSVDLNVSQAMSFASGPITEPLASAFREHLRTVKYKNEDWDKAIRNAHEPLREKRRDALVAYLLAREAALETSSDLYTYFLIDVEMSACMKTSRLVQATQAVLLFINRVFLGLEPGVKAREQDRARKEWEWRQAFRVWQAARMVFFYPHNWMKPSLRIGKTPQFKELEAQLSQGELDDDHVETAYIDYLQKVNEISRLNVRGLCYNELQDGEFRNGTDTLYVFGRTAAQPYRYYFRERIPNGAWKPWEAIEQQIEGDHLIPTFWNRRLHLFWPSFIERRTEEENGQPYTQVNFSITKLQSGKWTPAERIETALYFGRSAGTGVSDNLERKTRVLKGGDTELMLPNAPDTDKIVEDGPSKIKPAYYDFAPATNEIDGVYFYVELQRSWVNNDLIRPNLAIRSRRRFAWDWMNGYDVSAYDDGLWLTPGGNSKVVPEYPVKPLSVLEKGWWQKHTSARPPFTAPNRMKVKSGFTGDNKKKLFSKKVAMHIAPPTDNVMLLADTPDYRLCFAAHRRHHVYGEPFFFEDSDYTYFVHVISDRHKFESFKINGIPDFLAVVNAYGVEGLLAPPRDSKDALRQDLRRQYKMYQEKWFKDRYSANVPAVKHPLPFEQIEFQRGLPSAIYFWEIFFHIPMLMAERLANEGKYKEALKWVSYVFNPFNQDYEPQTGLMSAIQPPHSYWMVRPFAEYDKNADIAEMMLHLATGQSSTLTEADRDAMRQAIDAWQLSPFDPFLIGDMRPRAYMLWVFKTYVELLISIGDSLFRRFTRESINEATQYYVIAQHLLGRRPDKVKLPQTADRPFVNIMNMMDEFSNAAVEVENAFSVVDLANGTASAELQEAQSGPGYGVCPAGPAKALYFCIPDNPPLLELWDLVEDRLYKIRHCKNIDGELQELALFAPKIDPGALVAAVAKGLSIDAVISELNAPSPHYRFTYLVAKANEFTADVKAFGGALLSALEKQDTEALSVLRSKQEISLQSAMISMRDKQIEEAKMQLEGLKSTREVTETRRDEYAEREKMITGEKAQVGLLIAGQAFVIAEGVMMAIAGPLQALEADIGYPCVTKKIPPGKTLETVARASGSVASSLSGGSSLSGLTSAASRRQEEYDFQVKLADKELAQIDKHIAAAEIRIGIAEQDKANVELQIEHSKQALAFMENKYTNKELYSWMSGELMTLHRQSYELAARMAKQAEIAYKREVGNAADRFIGIDHWEGGRKGLLAGEKLGQDLRRLEDAYISKNRRTYELQRSVSLRLLDPSALFDLIITGECVFELPEWLFQMDFPGLYRRRFKTLAISVPCVTGPQVPVHCKVTLLEHAIRDKSSAGVVTLDDEYIHRRYDAVESVITSSGLNDSGLFQPNLDDPRFLPFEGRGVISKFRLRLPDTPQFDYTTISDVVIHISYTALDGGEALRDLEAPRIDHDGDTTTDGIHGPPQGFKAPSLVFSMRHDMPDDWAALIAQSPLTFAPDAIATRPAPQNRIPYFVRRVDPTHNYGVPAKVFALSKGEKNVHELKELALADDGTLNNAIDIFDLKLSGDQLELVDTADDSTPDSMQVVDLWLQYDG